MTCCCGVVVSGIISPNPMGDLTAEEITRLVENAGGNVNALFRASMAWDSWSDVDLHMNEPDGGHIYYSHKKSSATNGELDVDMNVGSRNHSVNSRSASKPAVENIMYPKLDTMPDGDYVVSYVQYGVNNDRDESADRPYLLLEHRTSDEPRMSHYVLLKQTGTNLNADTGFNERIVTVKKTGANFKISNLPSNTKIIKSHNFDIGDYSVDGGNSNQTGNIAESGVNPTGA